MKRTEALEYWQKLLEGYQDAIEEEEKKLESLRKEERHIKGEMEKLR
jgi:septal ring factor EnvC (AmiA/AmiB activator)